MKEISFKMRKNCEQNRKFCVVKVETLSSELLLKGAIHKTHDASRGGEVFDKASHIVTEGRGCHKFSGVTVQHKFQSNNCMIPSW